MSDDENNKKKATVLGEEAGVLAGYRDITDGKHACADGRVRQASGSLYHRELMKGDDSPSHVCLIMDDLGWRLDWRGWYWDAQCQERRYGIFFEKKGEYGVRSATDKCKRFKNMDEAREWLNAENVIYMMENPDLVGGGLDFNVGLQNVMSPDQALKSLGAIQKIIEKDADIRVSVHHWAHKIIRNMAKSMVKGIDHMDGSEDRALKMIMAAERSSFLDAFHENLHTLPKPVVLAIKMGMKLGAVAAIGHLLAPLLAPLVGPVAAAASHLAQEIGGGLGHAVHACVDTACEHTTADGVGHMMTFCMVVLIYETAIILKERAIEGAKDNSQKSY